MKGLDLQALLRPTAISKHKTKPGKGRLVLNHDSGLRKLGRVMRRGRVPDERMVVITTARQSAQKRRLKYLPRHGR